MDQIYNQIGSIQISEKPSIFELIAIENLQSALKPALDYTISVYTQRYPRYLLWLNNRFDLYYTILHLIIEKYYIKEWNGSFCEHFYGLKRISANQGSVRFSSKHQSLSKNHQLKCFASIVFLPLISSYLDDVYTRNSQTSRVLFQDFLSDKPVYTMYQKVKRIILRIFLGIYPWLKAGVKLLQFIQLLRYTFGASEYHSIVFQLLKLRLKRFDESDVQDYQDRMTLAAETRKNTILNNPNALNYILHGLQNVKSSGLELLKTALPTGLFIYQFFEWWYSSDAYKSTLIQPIPPPPDPIPKHPDGIQLPKERNQCPICLERRINSTMIYTGYIFCYNCIYKWIEQEKCCPITRVSLTLNDLRRIFIDNNE